MSISGIYGAAAGVSASKAATIGIGVGGAYLGIVATSSVVVPCALFALAMGIKGNGGGFIEGVVPIVLIGSIGAICLGGAIGGILPTLALAATEVALRALH
jgi:hypothetical protein